MRTVSLMPFPATPAAGAALTLLLGLAVMPCGASAQATRVADGGAPIVTADDYARAEARLADAVNPLVIGGTVQAAWLDDERFTYRSTTADGVVFMVVDPARKTRRPAFDHARLAAALATASGGEVDSTRLPFMSIELSADGRRVSFDHAKRRYTCDVAGDACTGIAIARDPDASISPDGTRAVFIKDWNLWVRDVASVASASSRPKASRTSATPPTTAAGVRASGRSCSGRPTRRRSRRSSRTSARWARCISSRRKSATRR